LPPGRSLAEFSQKSSRLLGERLLLNLAAPQSSLSFLGCKPMIEQPLVVRLDKRRN
jgi:hypothetical protein